MRNALTNLTKQKSFLQSLINWTFTNLWKFTVEFCFPVPLLNVYTNLSNYIQPKAEVEKRECRVMFIDSWMLEHNIETVAHDIHWIFPEKVNKMFPVVSFMQLKLNLLKCQTSLPLVLILCFNLIFYYC